MTGGAFIDYLDRHLKQFIYVRYRKRHNKKIHRHKRKSYSLFQLNYIQLQSVTFGGVLNYI